MMKEIFRLIKKFDMKGLFIIPTNNALLQFFRYIFVGGVATIADWGVLFLCNRQIIMRSDIKLPQLFASWSNSL